MRISLKGHNLVSPTVAGWTVVLMQNTGVQTMFPDKEEDKPKFVINRPLIRQGVSLSVMNILLKVIEAIGFMPLQTFDNYFRKLFILFIP